MQRIPAPPLSHLGGAGSYLRVSVFICGFKNFALLAETPHIGQALGSLADARAGIEQDTGSVPGPLEQLRAGAGRQAGGGPGGLLHP